MYAKGVGPSLLWFWNVHHPAAAFVTAMPKTCVGGGLTQVAALEPKAETDEKTAPWLKQEEDWSLGVPIDEGHRSGAQGSN